MRVIDCINEASRDGVLAAYSAAYDDTPDQETWLRFKRVLNDCALVRRDDGMAVILRHVAPDDEDEAYIDVGGRGRTGERWALCFTDWSDWKGMEVIDETGQALTVDQIAAHLFYEMTWYGFPEQMIAKREELFDQVEEVKRSIDGGPSPRPAG